MLLPLLSPISNNNDNNNINQYDVIKELTQDKWYKSDNSLNLNIIKEAGDSFFGTK